MANLFISYTRRRDADSQFANNLRKWLMEQGHAPWMDVYNIPAGANWDDEIDKALYAGDAVLGVVSSASVESDNVKNEWASAQDDDRLELYLLLIEQCEIPYRFYRLDYIDFTKDPQVGWGRLHTTLQQRFPTAAARPASGKPKKPTAKSRPLFMNPIVWAGAGFVSLIVLALIVIALLAGGNNNGDGTSGSAAGNAEAFVTNFFAGQIDSALNYVCPGQQAATRNAFNNAVNALILSGTDLTVQNVECAELGESLVQCSYTLTYTNGLSQPVVVQLQTQNDLVCDPSLGF
jgi:hypothetical protein